MSGWQYPYNLKIICPTCLRKGYLVSSSATYRCPTCKGRGFIINPTGQARPVS